MSHQVASQVASREGCQSAQSTRCQSPLNFRLELGLGRFGGIAGSFLVAELSRRQLTFIQIFTVVAIPGLIAAAALVIK